MDYYPSQFVSQLAPLIFFQGVTDNQESDLCENSIYNEYNSELLIRNLPQANSESSKSIPKFVEQYNIKNDIWRSDFMKSKFNSSSLAYKVKFIGNEIRIPKKNRIVNMSPDKKIDIELSILSPFNQKSEIYPTGILDHQWLVKYKELIPSVFISVHKIFTEPADANIMLDEDSKIIKEVNELKNKLQNINVKFIEIIVSDVSSSQNPGLASRINNMRSATGLPPRTGLLFMPKGTEKEYSIFVEAVLDLIKPNSFDFYIQLERKFRKQRIHSPNISMAKFNPDAPGNNYSMEQWDARYSLKLAFMNIFHQNNEMTIKYLESAYDSLTLLADSINLRELHVNSDIAFLWTQIRNFLDILAINLVKQYLYLEASNKCYRRFDNHLQSVIGILKKQNVNTTSYQLSNWLSVQFEWFADLCIAAGIDYMDKPLLIDKNFSGLAIPQPGYLYLEAINFLKRSKWRIQDLFGSLTDSSCDVDLYNLPIRVSKLKQNKLILSENNAEIYDNYLSLINDCTNFPFHEKFIDILNKSSIAFQQSEGVKFDRTIAYTNFLLGEEYFKLHQYERAIRFFEDSLSVYENDGWQSFTSVIFVKLIRSFEKLEKWEQAYKYCLQLSTINESNYELYVEKYLKPSFIFANILKKLMDLTLDFKNANIFKGAFLFKSSVSPYSRTIELQLCLKNLMNKYIFPVVNVQSVFVEISGSIPSILLVHDENEIDSNKETNILESLKHIDSNDGIIEYNSFYKQDVLTVKTNLRFKPTEVKFFQFKHPSMKIGTNEISRILLTIVDGNPRNNEYCNTVKIFYELPMIDNYNDSFLGLHNPNESTPSGFFNKVRKNRFIWADKLVKNLNSDACSLRKTLVHIEKPQECVIIPRRPDTKISVVNPSSAYNNEIYELKLSINNKDEETIGIMMRPEVKIFNNNKRVSANSKSSSNQNEHEHHHHHHHSKPSSNISSKITSPRMSSLDVTDMKDTESNIITNIAWDKYDKLTTANNSSLNDIDEIDLRLDSVKSNSSEAHSMFIKIPDVVHKYIVISIECSFFTGENIKEQQDKEMSSLIGSNVVLSTRDTITIRIPILSPFLYSFGVFPKIRKEDIPNIFHFNCEDDSNDSGIVNHSRSWCGKTTIQYLGNDAIEILEVSVNIKTTNEEEYTCKKLCETMLESKIKKEIQLAEIGDQKVLNIMDGSNNLLILEDLFTTLKKNPNVSGNIPLSSEIHVCWKRKDFPADLVNINNSQTWKISLPLFEPRVLFEVTKVQEEEFDLFFHLENPTPKIFTFSVNIADNANFRILSSSKNEKRIEPLVVLPFSRQKLEYTVKLSPLINVQVEEDEYKTKKNEKIKVKIPHLNVFDLFYKVTLPVLLATNEAVADRSDIYLKI